MHYRNDDTTGRIMFSSMQFTQLEYGLSRPCYSYNFCKAHYLDTPTWATNLWQYCTESYVQMKEAKPWIYRALRINDFFLMDIVLKANLSQGHKEIFNRVRINLRLLRASDIVCSDMGTKIHPNIFLGNTHRQSQLHWPNVMEVPNSWLEIFNNVLQNVIQPQLQSTPLGK